MHPLRIKFERELRIRGRSERTIHSYVASVRALARYYQRSPEQISDEEIRDWLHHLRAERRLSASSLNVAVNAIRSFHERVLGRDPAATIAGVPHCKRATTRAEVYALAEIVALLAAAPAGRDRCFLTTVYACGLRLDEARHLQTADLDVPRMQLRVRRGKGAKERVLPLPLPLLEQLRAYWKSERVHRPGYFEGESKNAWLFQGHRIGQPLSKGTAQNIYLRAVAAAGVKRKRGIHTLRHSFATHLLEGRVEITAVQQMLGHTSLTTTARYLHVTAGRLGSIVNPIDLLAALTPGAAAAAPSHLPRPAS
jgi:site-specific recombinase XerD